MGYELAKLGKHAHAARRNELKKMADAPLDSGLEGTFAHLLKARKVPRWTRPKPGKPNALGSALGTGHRPDFLWTEVTPKGARHTRRHLAVFLDGGVHRARAKTFAETLRRINLCGLLPPEWTVFQFTDEQIQAGARIVALWHSGDVEKMYQELIDL